MMKKVIKKVLKFVVNSLKFLMFITKIVVYGELKNHIPKTKTGKVSVFANGPSLKDVLPRLKTEQFANSDFVVLNYFAETEVFWQIKPQHYCLADPAFCRPIFLVERTKVFFTLLEKVDWQMNVYVPTREVSSFIKFSGIQNKNLNIISVNSEGYKGFPSLRNWFYKKGLAVPVFQTVAIMAIYVAINSGYTEIDLYGVDHTFFDSLCVDENNHLCNRETHFYDNGKVELKPVVLDDEGHIFKISQFVLAIGKMFKSHDLLADYARYMNVKIINCTTGSMIDSYTRISQIS